MKRLSKQGFSMIELLVVLLIIGILAAIAAPFFLQNSDKTRASEAVAAAGSIRSAERNFYSQQNPPVYQPVTDGTAYFESTGAEGNILGVQIQNMKYFSPDAYTVTLGAAFDGTSLTANGFVIKATGTNSKAPTGATDNYGAPNNADVQNIIVEMDASGQTIWTSNNGTSWGTF